MTKPETSRPRIWQRVRGSAALAVATTSCGGLALFGIAWLATRRLTPPELGFFFTFLSLGAFVQLADFGLSYAALQTGGRLAGTGRLEDLPAIARHVSRWMLVAGGVATLVAGAIGFAIFTFRQDDAGGVAWAAPWIAYLTSVYLLQVITPGVSLREGSGRVIEMWRLRFVQEITSAIACLLSLHLGAGLWSLSVYATTRAVVAGSWVAVAHPLPLSGAEYSVRQWMSDVWPFQWRIGLSGLSGYLIFRAFAPIILFERGPVEAGAFGLAIALMNMLIAITTAWPMSQTAHFAKLAAAGRFDELRQEFPLQLWASTVASAVGTGILLTGLLQARRLHVVFAMTLPEPLTTGVVLTTAVVHHFVICFAVALRSEGREPLLIPSVIGGAVSIAAIWLTAHVGTLLHVAVVNLVLAAIGVPIVLFLYRSRQRQLAKSPLRVREDRR